MGGPYERRVPDFMPEAWTRQAACKGVDTEIFFVEKAGRPSRADERKAYDPARMICRHCPVVDDCLEYALRYHIKQGMWGAKTPTERQQIAKFRRLGLSTS